MIYLDNAATTRTAPEVVEAMLPFFSENYGNASSIYSLGGVSKKAVNQARRILADYLGAKPEEIYFTAGGTEADNWALKAAAEAYANKGKHIITTRIEHHAVLHTCEYLEKQGYEVTYVGVDENGIVKLQELEEAIRPDTILISVMYANNEIGTLQPIREVGQIAHERGILFHTDAVQAFGQLPINVDELHIDLLSASAHKVNGPKGVGALYIRNGVRLDKLICGGGQERSQRGGTTNTPAIVGMAKALQLVLEEMEQNNKHMASLRDHFVERVLAEIPYVRFNGNTQHRVPSVANFSFEFVEGEGILMLMDFNGIAVSSGSACSSGSLDPSHVLLAMGVPVEISHGSIRFSFGKDNTMEEVDYTVDKLKDTISKLRVMSPLFNVKTGGTYNV